MKLRIFTAVALALLTSACSGDLETLSRRPHSSAHVPKVDTATIVATAHNYAIHGVDVSKYQGNIDWQAAANDNVKFAYIKATEGADVVDAKFTQNWAETKAAGIRRGAYHFAYWCRSPSDQIDWFVRNVPNDPDALPPVLDVELTPDSKTCTRKLYRETTVSEMRQMLQLLERAYGKKPIIYTTVDFYDGILYDNALSEYPIWVRSVAAHPNVRYQGRKWHFWQYQSDGTVAGINGRVDRNTFYGDHQQWQAFVEGSAEDAR